MAVDISMFMRCRHVVTYPVLEILAGYDRSLKLRLCLHMLEEGNDCHLIRSVHYMYQTHFKIAQYLHKSRKDRERLDIALFTVTYETRKVEGSEVEAQFEMSYEISKTLFATYQNVSFNQYGQPEELGGMSFEVLE